ncbi:hypothetical protein H9P43_008833 [Blastocladiella emersonii ATCC 22665]|nr:hypothetical protein H9P43_008833 [Blastocladiella emersonii ATCC 22665]
MDRPTFATGRGPRPTPTASPAPITTSTAPSAVSASTSASTAWTTATTSGSSSSISAVVSTSASASASVISARLETPATTSLVLSKAGAPATPGVLDVSEPPAPVPAPTPTSSSQTVTVSSTSVAWPALSTEPATTSVATENTPADAAASSSSLVVIQRVATAWYAISTAVIAIALWVLIKRIRLPAEVKRVWWAQLALIVAATASNTLQLVYTLLPDGDYVTSVAWSVVDFSDYVLYALVLDLAVYLGLKRVQAALPPAWAHWTICWSALLGILVMTLALVFSVAVYYAPAALCPRLAADADADAAAPCSLVYLAVAQSVFLAADLTLCILYVASWRRFARLVGLKTTSLAVPGRLIVAAFTASAAMQLFLLISAFSPSPWEGSRIVWLAHTTLLVGTSTLLTHQLATALDPTAIKEPDASATAALAAAGLPYNASADAATVVDVDKLTCPQLVWHELVQCFGGPCCCIAACRPRSIDDANRHVDAPPTAAPPTAAPPPAWLDPQQQLPMSPVAAQPQHLLGAPLMYVQAPLLPPPARDAGGLESGGSAATMLTPPSEPADMLQWGAAHSGDLLAPPLAPAAEPRSLATPSPFLDSTQSPVVAPSVLSSQGGRKSPSTRSNLRLGAFALSLSLPRRTTSPRTPPVEIPLAFTSLDRGQATLTAVASETTADADESVRSRSIEISDDEDDVNSPRARNRALATPAVPPKKSRAASTVASIDSDSMDGDDEDSWATRAVLPQPRP